MENSEFFFGGKKQTPTTNQLINQPMSKALNI